MQRAALFLLVGIGLGVAGAFLYDAHLASAPTIDVSDLSLPTTDDRAPPSQSPAPPSARPVAAAEPKVVEALATNPHGTVQRAALYVAAARADLGETKALLKQVAAFKDPATRTFALDVLLTRYAELDPGGAVAAAADLDMPPVSFVALYGAWLKSSPTAALAALIELNDSKVSIIASGVIAQLGDGDPLVDRILAAVPARLSNGLLSMAAARIARDSPTEALARARKIADPAMRATAVSQVLAIWAQRDPRAAFGYVATLDAAEQRLAFNNGLWQQVASAAPEVALDRIDSVPADLRDRVQQAALQALALIDPQAALARLALVPRGQMRQQFLQTLARSFGERDADGALAWARSLQPPEPGVLGAVISGLAQKDPLRAIDLAAEIQSPMEQMQAMQSAYINATARDPSLFGPLLDRVLALPNTGQKQGLIQSLASSWAARDPAQAADWVVANGARASADVVSMVASQYGRVDPTRAVAYAARIPSETRSAWLRGVASSYAQVDPRAALDWVEQLRGSAEYDDAALAVVQSSAQADPTAAARVLETIGRDDYRRSAIMSVAMSWANRDPAAAANWATGLRDPMTRGSAMSSVTQLWANQDPQAAQAWVLSQPIGQARDSGLIAVISATARFGTPDASLLSALSSDQARIGAVQAAAIGIAQRDPDAASAFIQANVADPLQRDRLLSFIKQIPPRPGLGSYAVSPPFIPPAGMPVQGAAPYIIGFSSSAGVIDTSRGTLYPTPTSPPPASSRNPERR